MADNNDDQSDGVCPECGEKHPQESVRDFEKKYDDTVRRMTLGFQALVAKAMTELDSEDGGRAQAFLLHEALRATVFFVSTNAWFVTNKNTSHALDIVGSAISRGCHYFDEFVRNDGTSPSHIGDMEIDTERAKTASADELTEGFVAQAQARRNTQH
jgi:hypothetical protein